MHTQTTQETSRPLRSSWLCCGLEVPWCVTPPPHSPYPTISPLCPLKKTCFTCNTMNWSFWVWWDRGLSTATCFLFPSTPPNSPLAQSHGNVSGSGWCIWVGDQGNHCACVAWSWWQLSVLGWPMHEHSSITRLLWHRCWQFCPHFCWGHWCGPFLARLRLWWALHWCLCDTCMVSGRDWSFTFLKVISHNIKGIALCLRICEGKTATCSGWWE